MSESIKHWSKTINKLENVINVNNNTVVNITTGVTEVPRAESAVNAAKATADSNNNNIINTYATKKEVVDISSSQEIAGVKTFTSNPVISTTDNAHLTLQTTDITLGTIHNTTESCGTMIVDSKNNEIGSFLVNMIGTGSGISDNLKNSTISEMSANNGTVSGSISVVVENNGARYATAPSTPTTASSNEIVTVDYLRTNFSVNEATASNAGVMKLYSSTGNSEDGTMTRKSITEALNAKSPLASPALTGTPTAPTATAGTNTTQIATTEFVTTAVSTKANDSDVVKLSGNQTVEGTKTFSGGLVLKTGLTMGTNPTATQYKAIYWSDDTGNIGAANRLASLEQICTAEGDTKFIVGTYQFVADKTSYVGSTMMLQSTKDGVASATFNGTLTATAVYNAIWNDYAEFFPRGEETEAGDFVALSLDSDNEVYVKASKETSKSVGIHSDSFGHLIGGESAPEGQDFVEYNLPKYIPVGLVGRVRANIVGEVKKGDFIVISDIPGVGRAFNKETDSYVDIIGMACESSSEKDIKRIKVKLGN
jgi:hypothetical protein